MERLSRNLLWMAAANIASSLFSTLLFIYLARTLMPVAFGYLSYAFTIIFFMSNFIDLGLSTYGIREVAKDKMRVSEYVSEIVSFRLLLAVLLTVLFAVGVSLLPYHVTAKILLAESALMLFVFALATDWAYQGLEMMRMTFISFATTAGLQLYLIYSLVKGPDELALIPALYVLAACPIIIIFLRRFRFRMLLRKEDLDRMARYLKSSMVIWSISVMTQIYNSLDLFIIGIFRSPAEVGYFSIARRFTGGIAALLLFLANALLPRLSTSFSRDIPAFRSATRKFMKLSLLLVLFVFVPVAFHSDAIISLAFGPEYIPAGTALKLMMVGLVFIVFNLPYSTALIAAGLEKEVLKQAGASAAVSIFSNFILIPRYGIIGASLSFMLAELLALVWILWVYHRRVRMRLR